MLAKALLGWAKAARVRITTGRRAWLADATLAEVERDGADAGPQLADTAPDEVAGLLFTSGSTGVPKGVVYRHRHFVAQIEMLQRGIRHRARRHRPAHLPPFALFDPALGLTLDHSRHGSHAPGQGRSAQAARGDRTLLARPSCSVRPR